MSLTFLTFLAITGGLLIGYDQALISELQNEIIGEFRFFSKGFLHSLTLMKILGSLFASDLVDRRGRKYGIQLHSAIYFVGTGLTATSTNSLMLSVSRLLGEFAVGIGTIGIPLYIAESSPPQIRGLLVTLHLLLLDVGQTVACVVYVTLDKVVPWRLMFGVAAIFPLLQLIVIHGLPECPKLQRTRMTSIESREADRHQHLFDRMKSAIQDSKFRGALVICMILTATEQSAGYHIMMYLTPKFLGIQPNQVSLGQTIFTYVWNILGVIVNMGIVDFLGRKKVLQISIGTVIFTLILSSSLMYVEKVYSNNAFSTLLIIVYFGYTLGYSLGIETIPTVLSTEIFPVQYRGLGGGATTLSKWVANTFTSKTLIPIVKSLGSWGTMMLYAGCSILGLITVIRLVPETKHLTLEEIGENLPTRRERVPDVERAYS